MHTQLNMKKPSMNSYKTNYFPIILWGNKLGTLPFSSSVVLLSFSLQMQSYCLINIVKLLLIYRIYWAAK